MSTGNSSKMLGCTARGLGFNPPFRCTHTFICAKIQKLNKERLIYEYSCNNSKICGKIDSICLLIYTNLIDTDGCTFKDNEGLLSYEPYLV